MTKPDALDLFVFHRNNDLNAACLEGGAKGIVIDFETRGKSVRQQGFDTQINEHNWDDLRAVKQDSKAYVVCRINGYNADTETEVLQALDFKADEILIPMVRELSEVSAILKLVKNRARVSAMIETMEAVNIAPLLDQLPLARIYVGLNDLRICRGSQSIFTAVADGTVESIRHMIKHTPFGFGGLTIPGYGNPLPVELFLHEMTRLECEFTFLRRSFFKDTAGKKPQEEIPRIVSAALSSMHRDEASVKLDKQILTDKLAQISDRPE